MILSIMSLSLPFLFVCTFCFVLKSFGCAFNVISMGARATRTVNVRIKSLQNKMVEHNVRWQASELFAIVSVCYENRGPPQRRGRRTTANWRR